MALAPTRGHDADAILRDQLDADARGGVGALEVVDELREVLDGVDVVVGGRRDEAHAGRRVARLGDVALDLAAGQLATLACTTQASVTFSVSRDNWIPMSPTLAPLGGSPLTEAGLRVLQNTM
jgi:hypothetical protein